jgi:RNA polymerase sigma factor (sigma-70 family)
VKPFAEQTDEELMRGYRLGEAAAFEELYRRYSGRVYGYLRKRLPSREESDELLQGVFLKAHRLRHRFDPKYPFSQWIYVISKTLLLDHFRKQGRSLPALESEIDLSQIEGPPALSGERSLEILEQLNPEQRTVVEMRVFDEHSYDEIARKLGKTQEGVRQILSRALRKLRLEYKEAGSK